MHTSQNVERIERISFVSTDIDEIKKSVLDQVSENLDNDAVEVKIRNGLTFIKMSDEPQDYCKVVESTYLVKQS